MQTQWQTLTSFLPEKTHLNKITSRTYIVIVIYNNIQKLISKSDYINEFCLNNYPPSKKRKKKNLQRTNPYCDFSIFPLDVLKYCKKKSNQNIRWVKHSNYFCKNLYPFVITQGLLSICLFMTVNNTSWLI